MREKHKYLNIFRFFNENKENSTVIERNFTRALSLCLLNNETFLYHFVEAIQKKGTAEANKRSDWMAAAGELQINIEVDTKNAIDNILDVDELTHLYGVSITPKSLVTTDVALDADPKINREKNFTDIVIRLGHTAIVIEAKVFPTPGEDVVDQLKRQLKPIREAKPDQDKKFEVFEYVDLSWLEVTHLMQQVIDLRTRYGKASQMVADFLDLARKNKINWINSQPMRQLKFPPEHAKNDESANRELLEQRIQHILDSFEPGGENGPEDYEPLENRIGVRLTNKSTTEILPDFEYREHKPFVVFRMWPGGTKTQGAHLWDKQNHKDWMDKPEDELSVNFDKKSKTYTMTIQRQFSLRHTMGKWISSIHTENPKRGQGNSDHGIHNTEGFNTYAGLWEHKEDNKGTEKEFLRNGKNFEELIDGLGIDDWKTQSKWEEKWLKSGRKKLNLSIGYMLSVYIPFEDMQDIDRSNNDGDKKHFADFLKAIFEKMKEQVP